MSEANVERLGIFESYLADFARREKHRTAVTYFKMFRLFERWLAERNMKSFDRDDVLAFLEEQDWKASSKNIFLSAIRGWAKFQRGYAEDGATQARLSRIEGIRGYAVKSEGKAALSLEQIGDLMEVMDQDTKILLWTLLWFGFRVGELQLIQRIDWEKGELVVETEKRGGTRTLYFDAYTGEILKAGMERGLLDLPHLAIWRRFRKYSGYCFPLKLTPHICRHTFATHMAEIADRDILREMLGHGPRETTDIYVHPAAERVREVMVERHYLKPFEPQNLEEDVNGTGT